VPILPLIAGDGTNTNLVTDVPSPEATPLIGETTLATEDQVWTLSRLLEANWTSDILISAEYRTLESATADDVRQRAGVLIRPVRTVRAVIEGNTAPVVNGLKMLAMRKTIAKTLFPLYCDALTLNAATDGSVFISTPSDPRERRFNAGKRVALYTPNPFGESPTVQLLTIANVNAGNIEMTATHSPVPAGTMLVPLIEAELMMSSAGTSVTDTFFRMSLTAVEVVGQSQLPAEWDADSVPPAFTTYNSLPVFNIGAQYAQTVGWSVRRRGKLVNSGIGVSPEVYGSRGEIGLDIPLALDRNDMRDFQEFHASRRGGLFPCYVISPATDYTLSSFDDLTGDLRVVKANDDSLEWTWRKYIAIVWKDGTFDIADTSSLTITSIPGSRWNLAAAFPGTGKTEADIERITSAYLMVAADEIEERWRTDNYCETSMTFIELVDERDITIVNLPSETVSGICPGSGGFSLRPGSPLLGRWFTRPGDANYPFQGFDPVNLDGEYVYMDTVFGLSNGPYFTIEGGGGNYYGVATFNTGTPAPSIVKSGWSYCPIYDAFVPEDAVVFRIKLSGTMFRAFNDETLSDAESGELCVAVVIGNENTGIGMRMGIDDCVIWDTNGVDFSLVWDIEYDAINDEYDVIYNAGLSSVPSVPSEANIFSVNPDASSSVFGMPPELFSSNNFNRVNGGIFGVVLGAGSGSSQPGAFSETFGWAGIGVTLYYSCGGEEEES
jgi:hypothetical protein